MNWRKVSVAVLLGLLGAVIVAAIYDVIPAITKDPDDTMTAVVLDYARRFWLVWFSVGVMLSHWLWTVKKEVTYRAARSTTLVFLGALLLTASFIGYQPTFPLMLVPLAGMVVGRLLWPMVKVGK